MDEDVDDVGNGDEWAFIFIFHGMLTVDIAFHVE